MDPFSRRQFVGGAAAAAWTARSYSQVRGAGERLRIGIIGCGNLATGAHIPALMKMREQANIDILHVSDVYDKHAERAAERSGAKVVKDYRRILDSKDIDYVTIVTPEHWHYDMTMHAADAGKHIYCEKPMTQTTEQARKVVAKIKQAGLQMQVGVQGMSDDSYETANEYVKDGALGKVVLAQIDYSRNYKGDFWAGPLDADVKPGVNLDWKAWLGPAPKRPFDPDRFQYWRRYWDYSGGIASDLFIHRVTRIIKALDLTFPEYGAAMGGKFQFTGSKAEIPDTFNILLDYPEGLTVQLISSMANDAPVEHMLRGHKATLTFTRTGFEIKAQRMYANEVKPVVHKKTGGEDILLHHRNLQNAIRRGERLKCDANLGYYGVAACELGVQSYRRRKYMAWDKDKERPVAV